MTMVEVHDRALTLARNPICASGINDNGVPCHSFREMLDTKHIQVLHVVATARQSIDDHQPAEIRVNLRKVSLKE